MVHVTEYFGKDAGGRTPFSVELLPPRPGEKISLLKEVVEDVIPFDPSFVSITYHQARFEYVDQPGNTAIKVYDRKRPGTILSCAAIKHQYGIETVPHMICGGFSKRDTEDGLVDLHHIEIDNVLALRGDPIKGQRAFEPHQEGNSYAYQLVKQIADINKGEYVETVRNPHPTDFCIGVAGHPEKHPEAANSEVDLEHLANKVDAGADYIITQMFFDNSKYFDFVDRARDVGIDVPIIPGIKPLSSLAHLSVIPHIFSISIPQDLVQIIKSTSGSEDIVQKGIEWTISQSRELIEGGVPDLHFYTMNKTDQIVPILQELYGSEEPISVEVSSE